MRVAHVLMSTGFGGMERMAATLYRLIRDDGIDSSLFVPPVGDLCARIENETGEPLPPQSASSASDWRGATRRFLRSNRPDVVHLHLPTPAMLGFGISMVPRRCSLLATFHLLPPVWEDWPMDRRWRIPSRWMVRGPLAWRMRTLSVAVSRGDRQRLQALLPQNNVKVVTNVAPLPPAVEDAPYCLKGPADTIRLLAVGRLDSQKGFDRVLRALADERIRRLTWSLTIAGDGPERARLEAQVHDTGLGDRVHFLGYVPAHRLFGQADWTLIPSRYEGMPLVLLEALQAGCPPLASPIAPHLECLASMREALLPDKETDWPESLERILSGNHRNRLLQKMAALRIGGTRKDFAVAYQRLYTQVSGAERAEPVA